MHRFCFSRFRGARFPFSPRWRKRASDLIRMPHETVRFAVPRNECGIG
jgi:hypothetical protein